MLAGWQLSTIVNFASGTPFTVYDTANVALQGPSPEITGFYSSRPNLVSDPNLEPHTADQWVSRAALQPLDPVSQAGQFGNEGRNAVRGPGISNIDLSLLKSFAVSERARAPAVPGGVLQSGQPRQLRTAGQRRGFSEFWPSTGGRRAQADGVRS